MHSASIFYLLQQMCVIQSSQPHKQGASSQREFHTNINVAHYVESPTAKSHILAIANCRWAVAPIRVETDRYDGTVLIESVYSHWCEMED